MVTSPERQQGPTHRIRLEDRLIDLARRQHGLLTRAQLIEVGLTKDRIQTRLEDRRLSPVHRGIYRLGPLEAEHSRQMGAVLACGPGAVLSHETAAELWGLVMPGPPNAPVHVTRVGSERHREGVITHRASSLPKTEVTEWRRIPITTPARTLVDLARSLAPRELEQALARAERGRISSATEVMALLAHRPRRAGNSALRALASDEASLTRSKAEERVRVLLDRAQLPAPRRNIRIVGLEVDAVWTDEKIVLEVDGFEFHSSRTSFEEDRRRDARLAAAGYVVLRITWRQLVREPEAVVARLAGALARSSAR